MSDSSRISGVFREHPGPVEKPFGLMNPFGDAMPMQSRQVLHHRGQQRIPLRMGDGRSFVERPPLRIPRRVVKSPRQPAYDGSLDVALRPTGGYAPGVVR